MSEAPAAEAPAAFRVGDWVKVPCKDRSLGGWVVRVTAISEDGRFLRIGGHGILKAGQWFAVAYCLRP